MKRIKLYGMIIGVVFIIYVVALCYISTRMNDHPYRIKTSASQEVFDVSLQDKDRVIYVPITIENKSNRLISTNNNISMGYHLYAVDKNGKQTMVSWDNTLTSIEDVFNNETGICNVALYIPDKAGKYIYYVDVLDSGKCWFSEKGVLTIPVIVEVK